MSAYYSFRLDDHVPADHLLRQKASFEADIQLGVSPSTPVPHYEIGHARLGFAGTSSRDRG